MSLKDVQLVFPFFIFFLYYAYPIILNNRLCRINLFFSAALFYDGVLVPHKKIKKNLRLRD